MQYIYKIINTLH